MTLDKCEFKKEYTIKKINADESMIKFLVKIGCYKNSKVTVINYVADKYIINVKNCKYALDKKTAKLIEVM